MPRNSTGMLRRRRQRGSNRVARLIALLGGDAAVKLCAVWPYRMLGSGGVVDSWQDIRGGAYPTLVGAGAERPAIGATGAVFDGVDDLLSCDAVGNVGSGSDIAHTVMFIASMTDYAVNRAFWSLGSTVGGGRIESYFNTGNGAWRHDKFDNSGASSVHSMNTLVLPFTGANVDQYMHTHTMEHAGDNIKWVIDNIVGMNTSSDVGVTTLTKFTVGANRSGFNPVGKSHFLLGEVRAVVVLAGIPLGVNRAAAEAALRSLAKTPNP